MAESIPTMLVTDVPFWNGRTGAQVRIAELARHLNREPFELLAMITQTAEQRPANLDGIPFGGLDLSQPPRHQRLAWLRWQMSAVANYWGWQPRPHRATFNRYYPQIIVDQFVDRFLRDPPRILLLEYATQVQLLRALPRSIRQQTVTVLDSHDILWKRARQFAEQGQRHWIEVTAAEEEAALREFDLIIAISQPEAEYFREIVGPERVIVTGMEFEPLDQLAAGDRRAPAKSLSSPGSPSGKIRIGHLASSNWANQDTVRQMLDCWSELTKHQGGVELILAGGICECEEVAQAARQLPSCRVLGSVDTPDDFYREVDLIWNPVRFGTGLKIKNLEALAWAKCLVTSPHGAAGLELPAAPDPQSAEAAAVIVLEQANQLDRFLRGKTVEAIRELGKRGQRHLQLHFGPGTQYPRLRSQLESLLSAQKS